MKYAFSSMLNKPGHHSIAAVSYMVHKHVVGKHKGQPYKNTTLSISDCTKVINLLFSWETAKGKSNSLHKINTLRKALDELEKVIKE